MFLLALLADNAFSQTPDRSSDVYQDWILNCSNQLRDPAEDKKPVANQAKTNSICEIVQSFRNNTNNQVVAVLAYGKPDATSERKFVIQVPVGVWLPDGLSLVLDGKNLVTGQYLRCNSSICLAQTDAKKEVIDAFKSDKAISIEFSDANRARAKLSISLKGFSEALAALDKRGI